MRPMIPPTPERRQRPFRQRNNQGVTTLLILVVAAATLTIVASLLAVTTSQLRMTQKQDNKLRALMLAESGVDLAVQQLAASTAWTGTGNNPVTLYQNPNAGTGVAKIPLGTLSVTVSSAGTNLFRVNSTGTNANGSTAAVSAILQAQTSNNNSNSIGLGRYAILTKNNIDIGGTPDIWTTPLNDHDADCFSDNNLSMGGSPSIDGSVQTVGTQSYNGTPTVYGGRTSGVSPIAFPTEANLTSWEATWITQSKATNKLYDHNKVLTGSKTNVSLESPCYIDGDLNIGAQQTLSFTGSGTVYVAGDIKIAGGGVIKNAATLIVKGGLSQNGNGYVANPNVSGNMATIVCLNGVFELKGNVSHNGIMYAARANIEVAGDTTFTGSVISGVDVHAQGNYTQYFPGGMQCAVSFPQPVVAAIRVVSIVEP